MSSETAPNLLIRMHFDNLARAASKAVAFQTALASLSAAMHCARKTQCMVGAGSAWRDKKQPCLWLLPDCSLLVCCPISLHCPPSGWMDGSVCWSASYLHNYQIMPRSCIQIHKLSANMFLLAEMSCCNVFPCFSFKF